MDLEVEWNGRTITVPLYLRSDQGTYGSERRLLGTNVVILSGLMVPGPGVEPRGGKEYRPGAMVRLIWAERIPGHCGVVVEAQVGQGAGDGPVLVEQALELGRSTELQIEESWWSQTRQVGFFYW